jgi:alanine racemase
VVKADGYGLGAAEVSRALAQAGARTFFVAVWGEAAALRAALGAGPTIYVLNGFLPGDPRDGNAQPVLNDVAQAQAWVAAGGGAAAVQLETGMNRLGAPASDWAALAALIPAPSLVMSHLACASAPGHAQNEVQHARFLEANPLWRGVRRSFSASGGALLGPRYAFDVLRPGIGLYGGAPLDSGGPDLACVASVHAPILQIRTISPGETVGYGASFTAARETRIATVALGYADGWPRSLSGKGWAHINAARVPYAGRVSMDLITLDVTGVACAAGDMVEMLGPNAQLDALAAAAGTIGYEILTGLRGMGRV